MDIVTTELINSLQLIDKVNEYIIFTKYDPDGAVADLNPNFKIVQIPGGSYPIWEQFHLPKYVKKHKIDLLHCTSNTAPVSLSVPLVLTLHDIIYLESFSIQKGSWYQRLGNLYRRWNIPKIINRCAVIGTVSDFERNNILSYFSFPEERIRTLPNAVGESFQVIQDQTLVKTFKNQYQLPDRFILALGNKDPRKNLTNIIKSYALLNKKGYDIPLFITDMEAGYLHDLLRKLNVFHLRDKIISSGYIPNSEMVVLYNMASIFLFPSKRESFGLPVLESMACGTPVVSSTASSIPEVAGNAALLVDPNDNEAIADGIAQLLSNEELYNQFVAKGIERSKKFRWINTAEKWVRIYEEVYQKTKATNEKENR